MPVCLLARLNPFLLRREPKSDVKILVATNVFTCHPLISGVSSPWFFPPVLLPFLVYWKLIVLYRSFVVLPWPSPSLHIKASLVLQLSLLHGLLLFPLLLTQRCCLVCVRLRLARILKRNFSVFICIPRRTDPQTPKMFHFHN